MMADPAVQRANMVAAQLRPNDVTDARIRDAMLNIPREQFVPEAYLPVAYAERCIPLEGARTLLDPRTLAKLLQLAEIGPGDRVLDVGCGTGYSTAILSMLASEVVGLEESKTLADRVRENLRALGVANASIVSGKLAEGCPQHAPFDVIFMNGAVDHEPTELLKQLTGNGRLVVIKRDGSAGHGVLYLRHKDAIGERSAFDAHVPLLPGFERPPSFVF
jgi:protein-L-isoaspartate(D-aspartate) O-methyltransferase